MTFLAIVTYHYIHNLDINTYQVELYQNHHSRNVHTRGHHRIHIIPLGVTLSIMSISP